jgi:DNA-binding NarL/FixJ family response regulator
MGLIVMHPGEVDAMFPAAPPASQPLAELTEPLTPRESEVLQMLASGLANKEIAARLAISEHTVKFHVASILGKLGAGSRTEAVSLGIRRGLILL